MLAAIIVEQHPQAILRISDSAVVLDQGTVRYDGSAEALLRDHKRLGGLIGPSSERTAKHPALGAADANL